MIVAADCFERQVLRAIDEQLVRAAGRDDNLDVSLRPSGFSDFVGQADARANLEVFIEAAKKRGSALCATGGRANKRG